MRSLAKQKHATVAVAKVPLLRKMGARTDFDDVYVCYAFIALRTPVVGPHPGGSNFHVCISAKTKFPRIMCVETPVRHRYLIEKGENHCTIGPQMAEGRCIWL